MKYLLVVLMVALVGCSVNSDVISWAEKSCEGNDGLMLIVRTGPTHYEAVCENGAKFSGKI